MSLCLFNHFARLSVCVGVCCFILVPGCGRVCALLHLLDAVILVVYPLIASEARLERILLRGVIDTTFTMARRVLTRWGGIAAGVQVNDLDVVSWDKQNCEKNGKESLTDRYTALSIEHCSS